MKHTIILVTTLLITSCYAVPSMAAIDYTPRCKDAAAVAQYIADTRIAGVAKEDILATMQGKDVKAWIILTEWIYSLEKEALPYVGRIVYTKCMLKHNSI